MAYTNSRIRVVRVKTATAAPSTPVNRTAVSHKAPTPANKGSAPLVPAEPSPGTVEGVMRESFDRESSMPPLPSAATAPTPDTG
ncbi:hypothetical protein C6A85_40125, partial [Mycobacterium sp. ITM-2017-0098]